MGFYNDLLAFDAQKVSEETLRFIRKVIEEASAGQKKSSGNPDAYILHAHRS